jgi:hypothetical protein
MRQRELSPNACGILSENHIRTYWWCNPVSTVIAAMLKFLEDAGHELVVTSDLRPACLELVPVGDQRRLEHFFSCQRARLSRALRGRQSHYAITRFANCRIKGAKPERLIEFSYRLRWQPPGQTLEGGPE